MVSKAVFIFVATGAISAWLAWAVASSSVAFLTAVWAEAKAVAPGLASLVNAPYIEVAHSTTSTAIRGTVHHDTSWLTTCEVCRIPPGEVMKP